MDFCFLKNQTPLSPEAYQKALQLCDAIRNVIEGRADYLKQNGLDPNIHLPMANWDLREGLHDLHRTIMAGDYGVLNNLRLFTQIFSGFQLMSQTGGEGLPLPTGVPENLDEKLAQELKKMGEELPEDVKRYVQTVRYLPEILHISPPQTMGEVGWLLNGKIVNHDTDAYLERIVLLASCGKLWELRDRSVNDCPIILEIGSGYGGLAYHIKKLIPNARYILADLPESLLTSSIYLSSLFPGEDNILITPKNTSDIGKDTPGFTFLPNFLFNQILESGLRVDLAINTLSMSEMTADQVRYYCSALLRILGSRGVFFEQNRDTRFRGLLDAKLIVAKCFPYYVPIHCPFRQLQQGTAHLWAATPIPPYRWRSPVGMSSVWRRKMTHLVERKVALAPPEAVQ